MELKTRRPYGHETMRRIGMLIAASALAAGCRAQVLAGYPPTPVSGKTAETWAASEQAIKKSSELIRPVAPNGSDTVPLGRAAAATLKALQPSSRHNAVDKRFLAMTDTGPALVLAQITLVEGIEYKTNSDFRKGWLPLAILVVPDSSGADTVVYPKLKLRKGTSWLFVRHDARTETWKGAIVHIVGGAIQEATLKVQATEDATPPLPEARFIWVPGDDIVWGKCGTNCCKVYTQ